MRKLFKKSRNKSSLKILARQERLHARWITDSSVKKRMKQINKEFRAGFKMLKRNPDTVTFFGSARFDEDNPHYKKARELAGRVVTELGSTVVTGGGGGIMEAANRGAEEAHGKSVGMTIKLPREQVTNPYVNYSVDFYYFFSRKVALSFTARAYIIFPGGFGTMDEFFEVLTLKQTHRIDKIPIVLVGKDFWTPLLGFINETLVQKYNTVGPADVNNFVITDDLDAIIELIGKPLHRKHK